LKNNTKDKLSSNKQLINSENERLKLLKEIENFNNIDFDMYQKLMFFDERYFIEANSFTNPNNLNISQCLKEENLYYTPISYEKMGISLLIAILDYEKLNPFSRIGNSDFKTIENLRFYVANRTFNTEEKYISSAYCQNYIKNLNTVKKFESLNEKIIDKITKMEKTSKRSNSMNIRKISNPYNNSNNNIVINNFNSNYFDLLSNGNFPPGAKLNINSNNNNLSKKITYNINVANSFMNNININNYNFNVHNYANSDNNLCKLFENFYFYFTYKIILFFNYLRF